MRICTAADVVFANYRQIDIVGDNKFTESAVGWFLRDRWPGEVLCCTICSGQGTHDRRFGHLYRQVRRFNRSDLRDL